MSQNPGPFVPPPSDSPSPFVDVPRLPPLANIADFQSVPKDVAARAEQNAKRFNVPVSTAIAEDQTFNGIAKAQDFASKVPAALFGWFNEKPTRIPLMSDSMNQAIKIQEYIDRSGQDGILDTPTMVEFIKMTGAKLTDKPDAANAAAINRNKAAVANANLRQVAAQVQDYTGTGTRRQEFKPPVLEETSLYLNPAPREFAEMLKEKFTSAELLPFINDADAMAKAKALFDAIDRVSKDEHTPDDARFLLETDNKIRRGDSSMWITAADMALQSLPFMAEFALTTGIYSAGKAAGRTAALKTIRFALGKALQRAAARRSARIAGFALGAVAQTAAQEALGGFSNIQADAIRRQTQSLKMGKDGKIVGTKPDESWVKSYLKATGSSIVETGSERTGFIAEKAWGAVTRKFGIQGAMNRLAVAWVGNKAGRTVDEFFTKVADDVGFNGVLGEVFEERVGDLTKYALGIEDLPAQTPEKYMTEFMSFAMFPFARNAVTLGARMIPSREQPETKLADADKAVGLAKTVEGIKAEAEAAPAAKESPEEFGQAIDQMYGNAPVFIATADVAKAAEAAGTTIEAVAAENGLELNQVNTPGVVKMPLSKFLQITKTLKSDSLITKLRASADGMSAEEAEKVIKTETDPAEIERRAKIDAEVSVLGAEMAKQLADAGKFTMGSARIQVAPIQAMIRTLAIRNPKIDVFKILRDRMKGVVAGTDAQAVVRDGQVSQEVTSQKTPVGETQTPLSLTGETQAKVTAEATVQTDGQAAGQVAGQVTGQQPVVSQSPEQILNQISPDARLRNGSVVFDPATNAMTVRIFKTRNLSTFAHESAHVFLKLFHDVATSVGSDRQTFEDWLALAKYLNIEVDADGTWIGDREAKKKSHEKFARSVEGYLMTGEAPSARLRTVFYRFSNWLKRIYGHFAHLQAVAGQPIEMNDHVKRIMDRMFAIDEEIEAVEAERGRLAMDMLKAHLDPEEWKAYEKIVVDAGNKRRATLLEKTIKQLERTVTREFNKAAEDAEADIRQEYSTLPDPEDRSPEAMERRAIIAVSILRDGVLPNGTPAGNGREIDIAGEAASVSISEWKPKISFNSLLAIGLSEEAIRDRFKGMTSARDGGEVGALAPTFGFQSGIEFANAVIGARELREIVSVEAEARAYAAVGIPKDAAEYKAWLNTEAELTIAADSHGDIAAAELQALKNARETTKKADKADRTKGRTMEETIMTAESADAIAAARIGGLAIVDIDVASYRRQADKAASEAYLAAAVNDWDRAIEAKEAQMIAEAMWRQGTKAVERGEQIRAAVARLDTDSMRKRAGKADSTGKLLDAFEAIIEKFDTTRKPKRFTAKMMKAAISEAIEAGDTAGENVAVPSVVDTILGIQSRTPWTSLTPGQLEEVYAYIQTIHHHVLNATKQMNAENALAFEDLMTRILESLQSRDKTMFTSSQSGGVGGAVKGRLRSIDAYLVRPQFLFDDLGEVLSRFFMGGAAKAQADMAARMEWLSVRFDGAMKNLSAEAKSRMRDIVPAPWYVSDVKTLTRGEILGVVFNMGNESSYEKLRAGFPDMTDQHVQEILDMLTKEEMDLVQALWDISNEIKPDLVKFQFDMTGERLELVKNREVVTKHGTYRGGYAPMFYDSAYSVVQLEGKVGVSVGPMVIATETGWTHARTKYSAPIRFDLMLYYNHMTGVIHDLSHRKFVIDANRVLRDKRFIDAMTRHAGPEYTKAIRGWLENIASNGRGKTYPVDAAAKFIRANAVMVSMGLKLASALSQFGGLLPSAVEVGKMIDNRGPYDGSVWLGVSIMNLLHNPTEVNKRMREVSNVMRRRFNTFDRDAGALMVELTRGLSYAAHIKRYMLITTAMTDYLVSAITWNAAYYKATHNNMTEDEAIRLADNSVERSQGSGGLKDQPAFMRQNNPEVYRLFTMFFTAFSIMYSQLRDIKRDTKKGDLHLAASRLMFVLFLQSAFSALLAGQGPGDDDDKDDSGELSWYELLRWYGKETAVTAASVIPFGSSAVRGVERGRFQLSPAEGFLERATRAINTFGDPIDGEIDKDLRDYVEAGVGIAQVTTGLPPDQLLITGGQTYDLLSGHNDVTDPWEWYHLLYRDRDDR